MAPTAILQHLKSYYTKDAERLPFSLSSTPSSTSSPSTYPTTRPSPTLSRDAPSVIRARIRLVTLSSTLSTLLTIYLITTLTHSTLPSTLRLLGWYPIHPLSILRPLLLTILLFSGPLFEKAIIHRSWRTWLRGRALHESLSSWIGWRNYIAGPLTEELIFRSLLTPLHLLTPLPVPRTVLLTPLYFGIAHVHHFYEYTLTHPHTPLLPALVRSLVQFAYTTLFGWYATFVFVRTGSLPAVVLAHSFCNWCGLPRLWGGWGRRG
ncbi:MAG: prenyl ase Rce1 [Lasallia pustulata]|uniref:intramembrane prenyl-peptidase Rce1 n=1 Tax=Lasallia pustulata TaxID=136370 RepID=A0A5M8PD37_9LECA|nr:MAG: prenyl ase Rce1 [Lasallia pustulata]